MTGADPVPLFKAWALAIDCSGWSRGIARVVPVSPNGAARPTVKRMTWCAGG